MAGRATEAFTLLKEAARIEEKPDTYEKLLVFMSKSHVPVCGVWKERAYRMASHPVTMLSKIRQAFEGKNKARDTYAQGLWQWR